MLQRTPQNASLNSMVVPLRIFFLGLEGSYQSSNGLPLKSFKHPSCWRIEKGRDSIFLRSWVSTLFFSRKAWIIIVLKALALNGLSVHSFLTRVLWKTSITYLCFSVYYDIFFFLRETNILPPFHMRHCRCKKKDIETLARIHYLWGKEREGYWNPMENHKNQGRSGGEHDRLERETRP